MQWLEAVYKVAGCLVRGAGCGARVSEYVVCEMRSMEDAELIIYRPTLRLRSASRITAQVKKCTTIFCLKNSTVKDLFLLKEEN